MNQIFTQESTSGARAAALEITDSLSYINELPENLRNAITNMIAVKIDVHSGACEMFSALEHVRGYLMTCKHPVPDWLSEMVDDALATSNEVSPAT